jgi:hypothetical protein
VPVPSDIDTEHDRLKAGKEHRVPRSARAIAILEEMKHLSDACTGGEHADEHAEGSWAANALSRWSNMAFLMLLRRMKRNTACHQRRQIDQKPPV